MRQRSAARLDQVYAALGFAPLLALPLALPTCGPSGAPTAPTAPRTPPPRTAAPVGTPGAGTGRVAYLCQVNPTVYVTDICTANLDGSAVRQLTHLPAHGQASSPAWSPDGKRLTCVVSLDESSDTDIYIMNADGSGQTNLTRHPEWRNQGATWSPDGATILFSAESESEYIGGALYLYVMRPDGSGVRRPLAGQWGVDADWSPDGARIVFMSAPWPPRPSLNAINSRSNRQGDDQGQPQRSLRSAIRLGMDVPGKVEFNLSVMNADGTDVQQLTFAQGNELRPIWRPDSTRILYTAPADPIAPGTVRVECFVMRADGSGATQVTFTPDGSAECTDWSLDGGKILFRRGPTYQGHASSTSVWVANPDGSGVTRLTNLSGNQGCMVYQPGPGLEP